MRFAKTIIIGAGPTGLSAHYYLKGNNLLLERTNKTGGLCRSFTINDVVFDIGGHSFHTTSDEIRSFIRDELCIKLFLQKRDAKILFKGSIIPYPWQKFYHTLKDSNIVEDCQRGLQNRPKFNRPSNLHEFILSEYGEGIGRHFLFPYNQKLWMRNLDEISCSWTSERIAGLNNSSSDYENTNQQRVPLYEDSKVGYPEKGGFNEIFKKIAARLDNIQLNQTVCLIDPKDKTLQTYNGNIYEWQTVVSTIPVPELVSMIKNVPANIVQMAKELPFISLQVDFFVTNTPLVNVPQRLYCADSEIPAHKIAFNSLSSEYEKDKPHHSIMAESSVNDFSHNVCKERTNKIIKGLRDIGFIKGQSHIKSHRYKLIKYAYPVQGHRVKEIMDSINCYLQNHGIYSIGRFGNWEYINSDQCLLRGKELANHLNSQANIKTKYS